MAAVKSIPLGQVAGQKILVAIGKELALQLDVMIEKSKSKNLIMNTFAPQLNILSSRHEHQYSRLFRS
jgi:urease accessory protein